jgi:hypothetical protein
MELEYSGTLVRAAIMAFSIRRYGIESSPGSAFFCQPDAFSQGVVD